MATKKPDTKNLKDLIVRLAEDSDLSRAYNKVPREVMLGAGVPKNQIEIIMSGDEQRIQKLLGDDHFVSFTINIVRNK
ncbi:MAG: hypothetical protein HWE16_09370 [Gammaproteobacteria bacterium]|nr:hypothetical protein [Gammaproteobacteria bacterium]